MGFTRAAGDLSLCCILLVVSIFTSLNSLCDAFSPLYPSNAFVMQRSSVTITKPRTTTTSLNLAKKKRRRRAKPTEEPATKAPSSASTDLPDFELETGSTNDDLPEFDLGDNEGKPESVMPKMKSTRDANPDEITEAMMGTPGMAEKSIQELLSDRALEKKFEFEEVDSKDALPDFAELATGSSSPPTVVESSDGAPMGKKKARQAARRAAAIEAKEKEEESSPLSNIPFISNDEGEISGVKVLEAGAWLGIGLLVLWEVYLNSPLFERAAPMVPVVYDFLM